MGIVGDRNLLKRGLDGEKKTYANSGRLCQESEEVETQFPVRRKCNTRRDHENNYSEFLARILKAERPRDEEDGHWCECL